MHVYIAGCAAAIPGHVVSSRDILQRVKDASTQNIPFPNRLLEMATGIKQRYHSDNSVNASDLAVAAAHKVLAETNTPADQIELVIWAAASQDVSEPATAHIVQNKLGISVAAMDVKNACNSFINGIQVAEALIRCGQYRNALIVCGETPSRVIRWDLHSRRDLLDYMAGYTFGDAGAAMLLRGSNSHRGIFYRKFESVSRFWDMGGVFGGGSMYPREIEYTYFRGSLDKVNQMIKSVGPNLLFTALEETGLTYHDFTRIFVHQATMSYLDAFLQKTDIPRQKVVLTLPEYGNMVAASMPVGLSLALERDEVKRGDKLLFLGIAGGLSLGVLMVEF